MLNTKKEKIKRFSKDIVKKRFKIQKLLNSNRIILKNLYNIEQNMANLLETSSTIYYYNCESIKITITNKINKIIINNCKNINIKLNGLISGLDVKNSNYIYINNKGTHSLSSLLIENSSCIKILMSHILYINTLYDIDKSHDVLIKDHKNKYLLLKS